MISKVSIIIPNYNHAQFLKQRIDSVLNQTYQDFELIILDDYSTDDSKDILAGYENHPKVTRVVFNEINSGSPFKQWSKGVNLAAGEYIWIAESDDFAEPPFLEKCVTILDENQNVGLVYSDCNIIEENKVTGSFKDKNKVYYPNTNWEQDHLVEGINEIEEHLIQNCNIYNVSGVLFRKKNIIKVIPKIIHLKYAGDWLCYLLVSAKNDIYYIADCLNNYRNHSENLTKKSGLNHKGIYERVMVRSSALKEIETPSKLLINKVKEFNLMDLRVLFGGVWRGRFNILSFFKIIKYYI